MTEITLTLANGRRVAFEVSCDLAKPSCFVLSVRKCGSTVLNLICEAIAIHNRRHIVAVGDIFFWNNVDIPEFANDPALLELIRPGNVYAGFRDMPKILLSSRIFQQSPKLLMVRDPRDALVSEFFSNAYSHPIPESNSAGSDVSRLLVAERRRAIDEGIDATVIRRAGDMANTMLEYSPIVGRDWTTLLKYEDYILNKRALILAIARAFDWTVDEDLIQKILSWADVRPEKEEPSAFVRRVTPGDHLDKLKPETITILNKKLAKAMELFGYAAASEGT